MGRAGRIGYMCDPRNCSRGDVIGVIVDSIAGWGRYGVEWPTRQHHFLHESDRNDSGMTEQSRRLSKVYASSILTQQTLRNDIDLTAYVVSQRRTLNGGAYQ